MLNPEIYPDRAALKQAIRLKALEMETAAEKAKPHEELLRIYKELKDLKFKLLVAETRDAI